MAQQVRVLLVDDIDGGEAAETISFSLDGMAYEIDLSTENADELRKGLELFVAKARRAPKPTGRTRGARTVGTRERSAAIREWARKRDIKVNGRGRIPASIVEQYEAAH